MLPTIARRVVTSNGSHKRCWTWGSHDGVRRLMRFAVLYEPLGRFCRNIPTQFELGASAASGCLENIARRYRGLYSGVCKFKTQRFQMTSEVLKVRVRKYLLELKDGTFPEYVGFTSHLKSVSTMYPPVTKAATDRRCWCWR